MWFSCSITWSPSLTKYFIISSFSSIFKAVLCHLYLDSWGQNACSCLSVCSWYFYRAILILRRPATHTLARRGQWVMGLLASRRLLLWAGRKGVCHLQHLVYSCTKLVHLVQNGSFFLVLFLLGDFILQFICWALWWVAVNSLPAPLRDGTHFPSLGIWAGPVISLSHPV